MAGSVQHHSVSIRVERGGIEAARARLLTAGESGVRTATGGFRKGVAEELEAADVMARASGLTPLSEAGVGSVVGSASASWRCFVSALAFDFLSALDSFFFVCFASSSELFSSL